MDRANRAGASEAQSFDEASQSCRELPMEVGMDEVGVDEIGPKTPHVSP
jgi:hypothetical protein